MLFGLLLSSGLRNSFATCLVLLIVLIINPPRAYSLSLPQVPSQANGKILLFRHALAPGGGDPAGFNVADCSTQRNLDASGQEQACDLGVKMRRVGLRFSAVWSSPWCRCMDTARLMNADGRLDAARKPIVQSSLMLGSFYEAPPKGVDKTTTMKSLQKHINEFVVPFPDRLPELMVTHYVVILALTGHAVCSGCAVLYDPVKKTGVAVDTDIALAPKFTTTFASVSVPASTPSKNETKVTQDPRCGSTSTSSGHRTHTNESRTNVAFSILLWQLLLLGWCIFVAV